MSNSDYAALIGLDENKDDMKRNKFIEKEELINDPRKISLTFLLETGLRSVITC